jgi:predicted PurR-regulated permease PerM
MAAVEETSPAPTSPRPLPALHDDRIELIAVLAILAVLIVGAFVVLRPFLTALLWALILSITTWPAYARLRDGVGGRRSLAALIMTSLLFVAFLLPIIVVGTTAAETVRKLPEMARALIAHGLPGPPEWIQEIPVFGVPAWRRWHEVHLNPAALADEVRTNIRPITEWLLATGTKLGTGVLELALSVLASFFVYRDGAAGVMTMHALGERLAGERARRLIEVAEGTMKGVVYGVIGTALAQGALATLGFAIAGVPSALFWGLMTCVFSLIPPGAPVVWLPATLWLFSEGETGWGIFMGLWGFFVVSTIDNFLKPYFISRGSALPLLLVFLGVLGGILAFGLLGVFIGPILLAVVYTLVKEWSSAEVQRALRTGANGEG